MSSESGTALERGVAALQAGDFDAAVSHLSIAVQQEPSNGRAYGYLGIAHSRVGNHPIAIASLQEAVRLQPSDSGALYNLGIAMIQADQSAQARPVLEQALALDPGNARIRTALQSLTTAAPSPSSLPPATALPGPAQYDLPMPSGLQQPAPPVSVGMPYAPKPIVRPPEWQTPSLELRLARGLGWGALYGQWWTLWTLFSMFAFGGGKNMAILIAFVLVFAVLFAVAGMGVGLIIGATNVRPDKGALIGIAVALALMGLEFLFFGQDPRMLINIFFWFFTGRFIGASVAVRVQKAVRA